MERLVYFITLGCPKNQIDSEIMQSLLLKDGFSLTEKAHQAQVLVINTCAFIDAAKEESIEKIMQLVRLKGRKGKLVVAGCLAQRYAKDLWKEIPEIDGLLGINQLDHIKKTCHEVLKNRRYFQLPAKARPDGWIKTPRLEQQFPYAYLKIADGCDNHCAYCAIPGIRGRYRSKPLQQIMKEAEELSSHGIKEVNIVAQDTTSYGIDLYGRRCLTQLLRGLSEIRQFRWIRLLYAHPAFFGDELIEEIACNDKICKYIDLPLQHISDKILHRMNRRVTSKEINYLIEKLRKRIAGLTLRTSFMVGFPGENREDFGQLLEFVQKRRFDRLGVFPYSREEGTKAYRFSGQLPDRTKLERLDELMSVQQGIYFEQNQKRIGKSLETLVESRKDGYFVCRSQAEAPEVDNVILTKGVKMKMGDLVKVRIVSSRGYDLVGRVE